MYNSKKDLILDAARRVHREAGSSGFSMRKVAASAGMSLGNLQYHFKTKETLFEGLLNQYMEQYRNRYKEFRKLPLTRETLSVLIKEILKDEASDEDGEIYRVLYSYAEAGGMSESVMDSYIEELYQILYSLLSYTASPASADNVHLACSLLIPYFESYGLFHGKLGAPIGSIEELLTKTIWELVGPA